MRLFGVLSVLLICSMILGACQSAAPAPTTPAGGQPAGETQPAQSDKPADNSNSSAPASSGKMTDVGTPRSETLVVDMLNGKVGNPKQFNPYMPGTEMSNGFHQLNISQLYDMDTIKGQQFPALAAEPVKPLDDTYTKFEIKLREGIYWSDGVEFTADDVVFTTNMILDTPELPYNGYLSTVIKKGSIVAKDKYTVQLETVSAYPRLQQTLGTWIWGNSFRVVPKHIWEKQDPTKFDNYPPVGVGPYTLKDVDPDGNWFLWERREDWQRTDVGMIKGEPKPKYVLFKFFGPEEKRTLAMIQNDEDILQDITPESWDILMQKSKTAQAWYDVFPYADMNDPCERGIELNTQKPPFDNKNVRWALALATDIQGVSLATFNGMLRVSPLAVPPVDVLQDTYHFPMESWLKDFALDDGYKPFDPDFSTKISAKLTEMGMKDVPTDAAEVKKIFGVGWWKYDVDEAAKLLEAEGFKKDGSGKWMLPDGSPWAFSINAPANFEVESGRLAYAVADSWAKFGIDVTVKAMDSTSFWDSESTGEYVAGSYWPGCGVAPDIYTNLEGWHMKYVAEPGQRASSNTARFKSEAVSGWLDKLAPIPADDPKNVEYSTELLKAMVTEMHWLPMFGTSKFVPGNNYYWTNYPTAKNPYDGPWWWWSGFKYIIPGLKPTGN
jgi:peptide/nickel transport system substrate-binding protein